MQYIHSVKCLIQMQYIFHFPSYLYSIGFYSIFMQFNSEINCIKNKIQQKQKKQLLNNFVALYAMWQKQIYFPLGRYYNLIANTTHKESLTVRIINDFILPTPFIHMLSIRLNELLIFIFLQEIQKKVTQ